MEWGISNLGFPKLLFRTIESCPMTLQNTNMRGISEAPWFCFVVVLSVISMPLSDIGANNDLDPVPNKIFQIGGGGGSLEEQCGSITFENMFEYSQRLPLTSLLTKIGKVPMSKQ